MQKINPIDKNIIKKAQDLSSEADKLENFIIARIDYIIHTIFQTFKQREFICWYFNGAGEGSVGDLWPHYNEKIIHIIIEYLGKEPVFIDKHGSEFGFGDEIPTRWLFEDFEQELIDGKKKFEELEIQNKLKRKEKLNEQQSLIKSAEKKLTKKELEAIKQTFYIKK